MQTLSQVSKPGFSTASPPPRSGDAAPADTIVLSVVIPVFNERTTILPLLDAVRAVPVDKEILVVDDASTDGTRDILRGQVEGRMPDVRVIYCPQNGGKGAAIRAAIPFARGEYVVIQDGDMEYDPQDFLRLLAPLRSGEATVVYGSRFLHRRPENMQLPNRAVNWLLAGMVRWFYGAPITDEATCYKMFRRDVLQSLPLACRRFEFCPEVTAKVLRRGHRIVEVPIQYNARSMAQGKKIRWTDGVEAVWTLARYRFWREPKGARPLR